MGLETGTYIDDFVTTNPTGADGRSQGDDHLRLVKTLSKNTFPNATRPFRFESAEEKLATFSIVLADDRKFFHCDASGGAVAANLPLISAVHTGFKVGVNKKEASANAVTLTPAGSDTINGAASVALSDKDDAIWVMSDGSTWQIVSQRTQDAVTLNGAETLSNKTLADPIIQTKVTFTGLGDAAVLNADGLDRNSGDAEVFNIQNSGAGSMVIQQDGTPVVTDSRQVNSGVGLTGGGNLSVDRTLAADIASTTEARAGTSDAKLMTPLKVKEANGWRSQVYHLQHTATSGTHGGAFNSGAWRTRTINAEPKNTISGASLSTNQVTLPAGDYYCEIEANGHDCGFHKARLRNITDSTDLLLGTNIDTNQSDAGVPSRIRGFFTLAGSKVLEIQHRCETTKALDGFGRAVSFGVNELYLDALFVKLG